MTVGSIDHDRKWRRTAVVRNLRLVPLPNDWSLFDPESGFEIARIFAEDDLGGGWRCIIRKIWDGELVDSFSGWRETGKEAREFCETQTVGERYILPHNPQINVQQITDNTYVTSARESGHIYILSNPTMPGLLKIGYTDRTPEDRARELHTTATPAPFVVEFAVKLLGNTFEIEQGIHNYLQQYRFDKKREFFRIDLQEAANQIADFIVKERFIIVDIIGNLEDPFPDSHLRVAQLKEFEKREAAQKLILENIRLAETKKREQEKQYELEKHNAIIEAEKLAKNREYKKHMYNEWKKENSGISLFDIIWCILWGFSITQFGLIPLALIWHFLGAKSDQFPLFLFLFAPVYKFIMTYKEKSSTGWGKIIPSEFKDVAD